MTLTVEMPPEIEARLSADAERQGLPLPEYVLRLIEKSIETEPAPKPHSVLELAREARESIPPGEWDRLPPDFARHLDHYLYGRLKDKE